MATPWITESTDVMNDPRSLMIQAQGRGRQARFARERLKEMQQERQFQAGHEQQASQFAAAHAQQERQRQDALTEGARRHDETLGQQKIQQQQLEAYRQAQLSQGEEGRRNARAAGLLNLAQSPDLLTTYGKDAPAIKKALLNQYYNEIGAQPPAAGGQAPAAPSGQQQTAVAPAAGGAPAATGLSSLAPQTTDPKATAVQNFQAGQGESVTQPAQGGQTQAATSGSSFAPSNLASDRLVNTRDANTGVTRVVPGSQAYDLNPNTAEYVPHNMEGTINGQPAGQTIAEGALRTGIRPESPSGTGALAGMAQSAHDLQIGQATTPPPAIGLPANVDPQKDFLVNRPHAAMNFGDITAPQQPQAPAPVAGAPASTNAGDIGSGQPQAPAPAGPGQYPSGAYSSGLHSGEFLNALVNHAIGQPSQEALAQAAQRRKELPNY